MANKPKPSDLESENRALRIHLRGLIKAVNGLRVDDMEYWLEQSKLLLKVKS